MGATADESCSFIKANFFDHEFSSVILTLTYVASLSMVLVHPCFKVNKKVWVILTDLVDCFPYLVNKEITM